MTNDTPGPDDDAGMNLPLYAYLMPHPLDDDSVFHTEALEWVPGFIAQDDEETGAPALWRESNIRLYETLERLAEKHFSKAFEVLSPLLLRYHFRMLQIAIDVNGLVHSGNAAASYVYGASDPQKGTYVFDISLLLMYRYVMASHNGQELDVHDSDVWIHELIHLMDHQQILAASMYRTSDSPAENVKSCLLKYREEGIASLHLFLSGHLKYRTMDEALTAYAEHRNRIFRTTAAWDKSTDKLRQELYAESIFYDAGPWLVLRHLQTMHGETFSELVKEVLPILASGKPVPGYQILEVIRAALNITPKDFLKNLPEAGENKCKY